MATAKKAAFDFASWARRARSEQTPNGERRDESNTAGNCKTGTRYNASWRARDSLKLSKDNSFRSKFLHTLPLQAVAQLKFTVCHVWVDWWISCQTMFLSWAIMELRFSLGVGGSKGFWVGVPPPVRLALRLQDRAAPHAF